LGGTAAVPVAESLMYRAGFMAPRSKSWSLISGSSASFTNEGTVIRVA